MSKLRERSARLIERHGLRNRCAVEVERRGRWFVLRGRVDCHSTRAQLFDLVPEKDGARWIVDHLRVGRDTSRGAES